MDSHELTRQPCYVIFTKGRGMCSEARRVLLLYQLYSRANIDIRIRRRAIQVQVTAAFRAIIPVPTDDGGAQGAHPL